MKRSLLILISLLALSLGESHGQIPTNGLIAYYPFNGNANDSTANNNDGTVNGATLTTDRFGDSNRAYSFNGTSNFIEVVNSASLQSPTNEVSISVWVQVTDLSVINWIIDKRINVGTDPYNSYSIHTANSQWKAGVSTNVSAASAGNTAIALNTWVHITSVYTGSKIIMYLDGIPTDSSNITGNILYSNLSMFIGKSPNNAAYTKGKIDDIRIYDRKLTPAEVSELFNEEQNTTGLPEVTSYSFKVFPNPASGKFSVYMGNANLDGYSVTVRNILGQEIYVSAMHSETQEIDLGAAHAKGLFFVTITDANQNNVSTETIQIY